MSDCCDSIQGGNVDAVMRTSATKLFPTSVGRPASRGAAPTADDAASELAIGKIKFEEEILFTSAKEIVSSHFSCF